MSKFIAEQHKVNFIKIKLKSNTLYKHSVSVLRFSFRILFCVVDTTWIHDIFSGRCCDEDRVIETIKSSITGDIIRVSHDSAIK